MNARAIGLVVSLALATGCAPQVVGGGTGGSSNASALDGDDSSTAQPLTDAQYVSYYYGAGVHLTSRGVIAAEWGGRYSDTLSYDMPDSGVVLSGYDEVEPALDIPDGSYTDVALFTLHKDADQQGILVLDLGDNDVAVRLARRDVGSTTIVVGEINGQPADLGNTMVACDYNIAVFPGGSLAGSGAFSFDGIKFDFQQTY